MIYKVKYSGSYYVEVDSKEEAMETDREDGIYSEWKNDSAEEVDDFEVEI